MEGKHVTDHHQHHHQSAGNGHRAQESHGVWVCHQCGWTYPNPHPSAKHRRNHRKHCGKIEGFPLISTGERETRGGSSDEELSDKEHKSTAHESRSLEIKGFLLQAEASAAISGSSSSDLNLTSKETVLGKAIQKVWAPANASISTSQITVLDGKVTGSDQSGGIGRETSKQFSTPSVDAGTETMGPLGHSTGGDGLSFEQKSNSFLKEGPHADSYHNAIGRFGHVDFPVKGHSVVSEYPGLKTQYRQADERVLPLSEEHVLPVIEGHPEFSDNADGLGLQITNGTSKQHTEVKGSSAKLQDTGLIDHQTNVSKLVTTPTYRTMESNSGISSRKVGIASILEEASYDGPNLDEFKLEISSLEETPESADKRIYELSEDRHQVAENNKQEMRIHAINTSDCAEGSSKGDSSGNVMHKETHQSLTPEPVTEEHKLPGSTSCALSVEPTFADNVYSQESECMISAEEKSTSEQDLCDKLKFKFKDCIESGNISPYVSRDDDICKDANKQNLKLTTHNSANSDNILHQGIVRITETVRCSNKDEPAEGKNGHCCPSVNEIAVRQFELQASTELVISHQDMNSTDAIRKENSKAIEMQQSECNSPMHSSIMERNAGGLRPDSIKEESTQINSIVADVKMEENVNDNLDALEKFPDQLLYKASEENSAVTESVQLFGRQAYSGFPGVRDMVFQRQVLRAEAECDNNEKGRGQSAADQNKQIEAEVVFETSIGHSSAIITTLDSSSNLNDSNFGHEESSRNSADVQEGSSKSLKPCEPSLWEQLLESNVKQVVNQDNPQEFGRYATSPGNPFIQEDKLPNYEEESEILGIEGRPGLTSKQVNSNSMVLGVNENKFSGDSSIWNAAVDSLTVTANRIEADQNIKAASEEGHGDVEANHSRQTIPMTSSKVPLVFEAPSFMTLVESWNCSKRQLISHEIQPMGTLAQTGSQNASELGWFPSISEVNESQERRDNKDSSADAKELSPGRHERPHTPLRSLLAEETFRGKQNQSKLAPPVISEEVQTSYQNNIQQIHMSTLEATHQDDRPFPNVTLSPKGSSGFAKKLVEKVWNSPARLPSPMVEKKKVKGKSAWNICMCFFRRH